MRFKLATESISRIFFLGGGILAGDLPSGSHAKLFSNENRAKSVPLGVAGTYLYCRYKGAFPHRGGGGGLLRERNPANIHGCAQRITEAIY